MPEAKGPRLPLSHAPKQPSHHMCRIDATSNPLSLPTALTPTCRSGVLAHCFCQDLSNERCWHEPWAVGFPKAKEAKRYT